MRVQVSDISFGYPKWPVLSNISFHVGEGEFLSVLGPNGSGKSTLLRLLARILLPGKGSIELGNQALSSFGRNELAKMIGYVPQETNWFFPFTVMEVVLMGRTPYVGRWGFENEDDIMHAHHAMDLADILDLAEKPITAISGGERQRVLIARALAQRPRILLLDEPNAHLDLSHQIDVFRILRKQQQEHLLTVISVSHDLNLAAAFSSSVLLLGGGSAGAPNTVIATGSPREVLTAERIRNVFRTDVVVDSSTPHGPVRISPTPESYHVE